MQNLPKFLFIVFVVIWTILALNPLHRFDWFLENIVIFLATPLVILSYYKFRLPNRSYILIFIFAMLHVAAAHYTYGDTPWGDWLSGLIGEERNHYDRIVHFFYGVLMASVAAEVFKKYLPAQKLIRSFLILSVIVFFGSLYEIAEFAAGVLLEPEKGLAFVGFQGDIWDAQKDMTLQMLGAIIALLLIKGGKK